MVASTRVEASGLGGKLMDIYRCTVIQRGSKKRMHFASHFQPNPIGTLVCDIFANWLSGPPESSPDQRL